mmetsp:Transcript_90206/g.291628  ORF Transcript_90206/g.291628 Transcript_90206/m.291628 type:complete len:213 (+) Transcript_90206:626-1264(+)
MGEVRNRSRGQHALDHPFRDLQHPGHADHFIDRSPRLIQELRHQAVLGLAHLLLARSHRLLNDSQHELDLGLQHPGLDDHCIARGPRLVHDLRCQADLGLGDDLRARSPRLLNVSQHALNLGLQVLNLQQQSGSVDLIAFMGSDGHLICATTAHVGQPIALGQLLGLLLPTCSATTWMGCRVPRADEGPVLAGRSNEPLVSLPAVGELMPGQ